MILSSNKLTIIDKVIEGGIQNHSINDGIMKYIAYYRESLLVIGPKGAVACFLQYP